MSDALELQDAALCLERIARYQADHDLSDVKLVRALPMLGSARTWRTRLAVADWNAAPLDVWLAKLQAAVGAIDGSMPAAEIGDAAPIALVQRHLAEAERCRREKQLPLARSHCRVARRAIEDFQRQIKPEVAA